MKAQSIELKQEIKEIIEARKNGQKITYVINLRKDGESSFMQLHFDKIEVSDYSVFFSSDNQYICSFDKEKFNLEFSCYHSFKDVFGRQFNSIHYYINI